MADRVHWPEDTEEQQRLARQAADVMRQGGLVVYPTDTVYGLGCNPMDEAAIRRIYEVKGRPDEKAIIWLVRDVELNYVEIGKLHWLIHHDEDAEIYLNGTLAGQFSGYTVQYETRPLSKDAASALRPGKNRIAIHCHQTGGGQYIDLGLVTVKKR